MITPVCDFLNEYKEKGMLRLHMPGHKGEYSSDITEITGADSLYETEGGSGIIARSEKAAAFLFGAERTCYSCGGSTLAIQTALALLKSCGCKTVAASRYSHRSFVSSCALLGLDIRWLYPKEYLSSDISDELTKLNADALFYTNVDYYGGTCKVKSSHVPTVCDNAHGAYLRFLSKSRREGYQYPMEAGFPIISAESAHKTLPVLTGGAYLHFSKGTDYSRAKELMGVFGSSSPSYLILESLDRFNRIIVEDTGCVNRACDCVKVLKERLISAGVPLRKSDPLRIVISAFEYGYTGFEFAEALAGNGVQCEMADDNYTVLLFSAVTSPEDCERAAAAILLTGEKRPLQKKEFPIIRPKAAVPVYSALFARQKAVAVENSVGEICGGIKAPCPPGVPIVMPGEVIDHETADALRIYGIEEIRVLCRRYS